MTINDFKPPSQPKGADKTGSVLNGNAELKCFSVSTCPRKGSDSSSNETITVQCYYLRVITQWHFQPRARPRCAWHNTNNEHST